MKPCPTGIITALPTPFGGAGIHLAALARFVDWQIREGCGCLAVGTATGEAPTLSPDERVALVRTCVAIAAGRVPVLAGIVASATALGVDASSAAAAAGADGLLIATPSYNKPTQAGLLRHVEAIAGATDLPIILHNAPGRSVIDIRPETAERLAAIGTVRGIVDAGDPARLAAFAAASGGRLALFGGSDDTALAAALTGAVGHLSLVANVAPRLCSRFQVACDRSDWAGAAAIQRRLHPLIQALAPEPDPAPLKFALSRLVDGFPADLRLPMTEVSASTADAIARAVDGLAIG